MSELGRIALTNAVTASVLGAIVACCARWIRRPALAHALWLVVLLDLVLPPVIPLALLPPIDAAPRPPVAAAPPAVAVDVVAATPADLTPAILVSLWLAGAAAVVFLAATRARRFGRGLREAPSAPDELQARAHALAAQ